LFIVDQAAYVRAVTGAMLRGQPFESLADWAAQRKVEEAAAKVINIADMRAKLRPSASATTGAGVA
jgi:hypothetical protein